MLGISSQTSVSRGIASFMALATAMVPAARLWGAPIAPSAPDAPASAAATSSEPLLAPLPSVPASPQQSLLRLHTVPGESHVYLYRADAACPSAVCTGACSVRLPAGSYRIEAGLVHSIRTRSSQLLDLRAAEDAWVRVRLAERTNAQWAAAALALAGIGGLLAGAVLSMARGSIWSGSRDATSDSLVLGSLVPIIGGSALFVWSAKPDVEVSRWKEKEP